MISEKYEKLKELLTNMGRVVVAFSGGVDSTFLLKVALDTLGKENVLAITADSETYPSSELAEAKKIAQELGAFHEVLVTSELNILGYTENTKNRCYFCKKNLFKELLPTMGNKGFNFIVYGLIADDDSEYRPGTKAAKELGVRGPLQEVGLYKHEIRELSKELNLTTWNKPSLACLSSRIAYGERITLEKLAKIEQMEKYLRGFGISQVRVRTHGKLARIEVEPKDIDIFVEWHREISSQIHAFGYTYVTLDLAGYQSGSMNKILQKGEIYG